MEPENPSVCDVFVDLTAAKRMFMQLIDVHRFGDWRIFLDGEEPDEPDLTSYDPENTPPWIIHREDLDAMSTRNSSAPPPTPTSADVTTKNRRSGTAPRV